MTTKCTLLPAACLPLMLLFAVEGTPHEQHHLRKRQTVYNTPDANDLPGLWCYQCQDRNSNETACAAGAALVYNQERVRRLLASGRRDARSYGVVDCHQWASYCVIEEVFLGEKNGSSTYYRDCSDGQPHSFTATPRQPSTPDNRTRCWFDEVLAGQICLTLCQGDFCNGPERDPPSLTSTGSPARPVKWLLVLLTGLFYELPA